MGVPRAMLDAFVVVVVLEIEEALLVGVDGNRASSACEPRRLPFVGVPPPPPLPALKGNELSLQNPGLSTADAGAEVFR